MEALEKQNITLFEDFKKYNITQLQELIYLSQTREEKLFYNKLLNLRLALEQEKVIGKKLL